MLLLFPTDSDPDLSDFGPTTANVAYDITSEFSATEIKTKNYSTDENKNIVLDYFTVEKQTPFIGNVRQMKFGTPAPDSGDLARLRDLILTVSNS